MEFDESIHFYDGSSFGDEMHILSPERRRFEYL